MTIKEMQKEAWTISESKGFHKDHQHPAVRLMLVVSELSEACEELRKGHTPTEVYEKNGKPEGFPIEMADAVIRIGDLCEAHGVDLQGAIKKKLGFNKTRPQMHGGRKF